MAYQTPQLVSVGSATGLVLGVGEDVGVFSDHPLVLPPLVRFNSRYTFRD